jgi:hypothetical protein
MFAHKALFTQKTAGYPKDSPGRRIMANESLSRKISFLRAGWWIVHVLGISLVYFLGHLLWS